MKTRLLAYMTRSALTVLPILLLTFVSFTFTHAQLSSAPGTWDGSFGRNGFVRTPVPGGLPYNIQHLVNDLVVQPDGKIIAAGQYIEQSQDPALSSFMLVRYNPNGTFDPEFGENGVLMEPGLHSYKILKALPNGDLIAARTHKLLLLNENGRLLSEIVSGEDTFIEGRAFWPEDFVLQTDGKVLSLGKLPDGSFYHQRGIVRFLPNGKVDDAFGFNGVSPALPREIDDSGEKLRLQPDGKIIYGGSTLQYPNRIILTRLNGDPQAGLKGPGR
jgi:uncharacterized delta-60 repeat protein